MPSDFFSGRAVIEAGALSGPRVYSTDLLQAHLDPHDADGSVRNAARALKIKMITKGLVVVNSTHLADPLGMLLCMAHPDLVIGGGLLSAFRVGDPAVRPPPAEILPQYAALGFTEVQVADHIGWLNTHVSQVMPWEIGDVGERLRARLLDGLAADDTPFSRFLRTVDQGADWRERLTAAFAGLEMRRDRYLNDYIASLPDPIRARVSAYAQAAYHAVGTAVVNCETGTDLSPLSKFTADRVMLANRDASVAELSNESVFMSAFLGYALDQINCLVMPMHIIDAMTFHDVHRVSQTLRHQGFQATYDRLLAAALPASLAAGAGDGMEPLDFQTLAAAAREVAQAFQTYINTEFEDYRTHEFDRTRGEAFMATGDVALDLAGAIPGPGSLISLAKTGVSIATAVGMSAKAFNLSDNEAAFSAANTRRQEEITAVIGRLHVSGGKKTQLLDAAAALSDIYAIRSRRA